jgi:hypothetical protein
VEIVQHCTRNQKNALPHFRRRVDINLYNTQATNWKQDKLGFSSNASNIVACRSVARQQIPNTYQWTNWEVVFSMRSVRQLRDATTGELLEACSLCGPLRGYITRRTDLR